MTLIEKSDTHLKQALLWKQQNERRFVFMDCCANELEGAILSLFNELKNKEKGSEDYDYILAQIEKLYKLKIDADKNDLAADEAIDMAKAKAAEFEDHVKDRWVHVAIGGAELVLPLLVYICLYLKGLKFEETGTVTSKFFGGLVHLMKFRKI